MFLRSLLLGATAALRVNAMLVVPEAEPVTSSEIVAGLAPVEAQLAQQQLIDLPCTECPFREVGEDGDVSWTDGFKTSLVSVHPLWWWCVCVCLWLECDD